MAVTSKNRYWVGVLYLENMIPDWKDCIADLLQLPFCYCIHDADTDSLSEHRKDHLHLIICFPNTTTYKHAMEVFMLLSAPGRIAINTCQAVINVRFMYEYLIHNTDACRSKGKHLYKASERISGNNFDIGNFEQVSLAEKRLMRQEIAHLVIERRITNFIILYQHVIGAYDSPEYEDLLASQSGFFERLCKGNYLLMQSKKVLDQN